MKVGYLHLTQSPTLPLSGVTRYGQKLAAAASQRDNLTVFEAHIGLSPGVVDLSQQLSRAAKTLAATAVVHVQYSQFVWHEQILDWLQTLPIPVVVTLHDLHPHLYPPGHWGQLLWQANQQQRARSGGRSLSLRSTGQQFYKYWCDRTALAALGTAVDRLLTCHRIEAQRVQQVTGNQRVQVIPHFVEPRAPLPTPAAAKAALGLPTTTPIVTLQGFIYRTKGHELAVRALAHLPHLHLVFAGGAVPGNEAFLAALQTLAQTLGVAERLRVTGYLSDDDLDRYLAASDLAICPFQALSASGSLSTWIAAGTPILAADHPQIHDYNAL
ncbi:MAG: glycosyltransferase, partial [Cyanobacteria bacterium J06632_22]